MLEGASLVTVPAWVIEVFVPLEDVDFDVVVVVVEESAVFWEEAEAEVFA